MISAAKEQLTAAVRRGMARENVHEDSGVLDTYAAGVVAELLSMSGDRAGWVLDGESGEVFEVTEVLDRDFDYTGGYLELVVKAEVEHG
jgi:hypothetical protein